MGQRASGRDNWRKHSIDARAKLGVTANFAPWTQNRALAGVPSLARCHDLIDVAWISRLDSFVRSGRDVSMAAIDFFADVSQAVQRKPWGSMQCLCCSPLLSLLLCKERVPCGVPVELMDRGGRVMLPEHDLLDARAVDRLVELCRKGGLQVCESGSLGFLWKFCSQGVPTRKHRKLGFEILGLFASRGSKAKTQEPAF